MKTLTIRGLPDEVHLELKERAKKNRRSLNQEVIAELSNRVAEDEAEYRVKKILNAAETFRAGLKRPLSGDEIRNAIDEDKK